MDGTLVDQSERFYQVYHTILEEEGGAPLPKEEYWSCRRNKWSSLSILQWTGDERLYDIFIARRTSMIEGREFLILDHPFAGVNELLQRLQKKHSLYLISLRNSKENLLWQLERWGWSSWFEEVLTADAFGSYEDKKYLMAGLGLQRGTSLVIGDTESDIKAGKELGVVTVAVLSGMRERIYLEQLGPDHLTSDVAAFFSEFCYISNC